MSERVISADRIRREGVRFGLNGSEVFGIQDFQENYSLGIVPVKHLGMGDCVSIHPQGPQQGSFRMNALLITDDVFLPLTGVAGFNGYCLKYPYQTGQNFSFSSGYLTSYISRCSIGQIPQIEVQATVFGDMGQFDFSNSRDLTNYNSIITGNPNFPLKIVGPGSINIDIDDFQTNRVLSYDVSIAMSRTPIYDLGNRYPIDVQINYPIEINCSFSFDRDNYNNFLMRNYPCKPRVKDVNIYLNDYNTDVNIQTFSLGNMVLVSEQLGHTVDGNSTMQVSYRTYINR